MPVGPLRTHRTASGESETWRGGIKASVPRFFGPPRPYGDRG
jgi:hypothetical protein